MCDRRFSFLFLRVVSILLALLVFSGDMFGAASSRKRRRHRGKHRVTTARRAAIARSSTANRTRVLKRPVSYTTRFGAPARKFAPIIQGGPWTAPTFADSTQGDNVDGEDLQVRRAAVEALGPYNGSVVVVDPSNGRILSMVNQRLALGSGFQPCSTIKISVALAALMEGAVESQTRVRLYGRSTMALTEALARSNNLYFAKLGSQLGFEKVKYYANLFGYGEKAGLNIADEQPGNFPAEPPRNGGVGMLSSFGEGIRQTPLQLAALMSALANGGTLYYLQYPRSRAEVENFVPKVKRQLHFQEFLPEIKPGMLGAVEFGTARRAQQELPIAGKTGTCTDSKTHLGWFGSYNDVGPNKLVVVVLLTGGRPAIGPLAAGIAGSVYKNLSQVNYFMATRTPVTPASLVSTQICCRR